MKQEHFAVYDQKARSFCKPFHADNQNTAIRAFHYSATQLDNDIGRYPNDYGLYFVGTFDGEQGTWDIPAQPQFLTLAVTLLEESK